MFFSVTFLFLPFAIFLSALCSFSSLFFSTFYILWRLKLFLKKVRDCPKLIQSMCFLLVFSMIYSGFIKGEMMTFPASFSMEKLEYMRCLLSSPTIHDLDRCCIHYCKYRLACSLYIYDPSSAPCHIAACSGAHMA